MDKNIKNIHFMGIGGSGMAGVAEIAQRMGYVVSGCDLEKSTFYISQLDKKIKVYEGHSVKHLENIDLLVTTPAVSFQNDQNEEYLKAKENGSTLTWQEFLGRYLLTGKKVIAVSGTHGKSTITAMAGQIFENANTDPGVMVGAIVKKWKSSYRYGKGEEYIVEADEFNDNFLNYSPETIIINNIEFDHPDFFKDEDDVLNSFEKFIAKLSKGGNLIVNQDSIGIAKLFKNIENNDLSNINIFGYTLGDKPLFNVDKSYKVNILKQDQNGSTFKLGDDEYNLDIPGIHNICNATAAIILSEVYKIDKETVRDTLKSFEGTGRRMDLVAEVGGIKIYDDYAHHPTAVKATLEALRQKYPKKKIWVVYEPHSYSRTKALLQKYRGVFDNADNVIIAPIFKARDKSTFNVSEDSIVEVSGHINIQSARSFNEAIISVLGRVVKDDVIIVMGAGKSYLLTKGLIEGLEYYLGEKEHDDITIGEDLSELTTAGVGGPARFYTAVKDEDQLIRIIKKAESFSVPYLLLGGGSNVLVSDFGFSGLVIKNNISGIAINGNTVSVKAGESLQKVIDVVIDAGLSGIEAMSWIPGTVGGAINGNAGAYGQTISEHLKRVKVYDGTIIKWLSKEECGFSYRSSQIKESKWILLEAEFLFLPGDKKELRKKADEIIKIRQAKFPNTLKCPGSYFKNIIADDLPEEVVKKIPDEKIIHGKIPSGYLLEEVGVRGATSGGVKISDDHGNMIVNTGGGTASDFRKLATECSEKVKNKFGISLVPEVVFVGDFEN
jgi:UDP-N-acetylmuramate--alanine ligase